MNRHLKRYGWIYAAVAVVLLWPLTLWRMQQVKPLDQSTLEKMHTALKARFEREHPEVTFSTEKAPKLPLTPDPVQFITNFTAIDIAGAPAIAPEFEKVLKYYEPLIRWLDKMNAKNAAASYSENLIPVQNIVKLRRAEAVRAINDKDWPRALTALEQAANTGNCIRWNGLIGHLVAVATRAIAYSGYKYLLNSDAPADVQRQALQSLINLRQTDPVLDENVWTSEFVYSTLATMESKSNDDKLWKPIPTQFALLQVVSALANGAPDKIKDPSLRAWAQRYAKEHNYEYGPNTSRIPTHWTTIPSAKRWMGQMIEKEPWIYKRFGFTEAEYAQMDPWTLALSMPMTEFFVNRLEIDTRTRVTSTIGRLDETGFAARLYVEEHNGEWPKSMEDLKPFLTQADTRPTTQTATAQPYLPIQMGWRQLNQRSDPLAGANWDNIRTAEESLCFALWKQVLPALDTSVVSLAFQPVHDERFPNDPRRTRYVLPYRTTNPDWLQMPVLAIGYAEALQKHPLLADHVDVAKQVNGPVTLEASASISSPTTDTTTLAEVAPTPTPTPTPTPMPRQNGYGGYGYGVNAPQPYIPPTPPSPLTAEEARAISDKLAPNNLSSVEVRAQLIAPDKAYILWSPGPDGKDDQGSIIYDPTNGTTSSGDLVLFAEKF